jgi:geranylgeranyl diphosphate synthase type II
VDAVRRIEKALEGAFTRAQSPESPGKLLAAMRYAVFPRGARIRPRLCLAVAGACGEAPSELVDAAAVSIELLHCASLVHDDLPCFDDAETRRGRPSVHRAFDERLAVLAGDGLIVMAFRTLAETPCPPQRLATLLLTISGAVGAPAGIVAGQAWECELVADVSTYQRQKTGALFAGAAMAGAAAAGVDPQPWRLLGEKLGEAYQAADDIGDVASDPETLGKPTGRDLVLGRPSVVRELGLAGALRRLEQLILEAVAAIPPCTGVASLKALIRTEAKRLLPKELAQRAA